MRTFKRLLLKTVLKRGGADTTVCSQTFDRITVKMECFHDNEDASRANSHRCGA